MVAALDKPTFAVGVEVRFLKGDRKKQIGTVTGDRPSDPLDYGSVPVKVVGLQKVLWVKPHWLEIANPFKVGEKYYHGAKRVRVEKVFSSTKKAEVIAAGEIESYRVSFAELSDELTIAIDELPELQRDDVVQLSDGRTGKVIGTVGDKAAVQVPSSDPNYEYDRPLVPLDQLKKVEATSAPNLDTQIIQEENNTAITNTVQALQKDSFVTDAKSELQVAEEEVLPILTAIASANDLSRIAEVTEQPRDEETFRSDHGKLEPHPDSLRIELTEIRRDGGTQPRAAINLQHVRLLEQQLEDGVELEPVVVFYDGVEYWLADGFHRWQAHHNLDKMDIACNIRQGTRRDAVLYSAGANADHKAMLARSRDDKKRAVMMLLNDPEWSQWSDREIARQCRVDHKTVATCRSKLLPSLSQPVTGEFPSEESQETPSKEEKRTFKTKHGTIAQMKVPKKIEEPVEEAIAEQAMPSTVQRNLDEICLGVISSKKDLSPAQRWAICDSITEEMSDEELADTILALQSKLQARQF